MAEPTWREVAGTLAERLWHQAEIDCPHVGGQPDPDNCPFCADRAAYHAWQRKEHQAREREARNA